jgi:tetratricopeptide (TPR) repeat protein
VIVERYTQYLGEGGPPSVADAASWLLNALSWILENLLVLLIVCLTAIIVAVFFRLRRSILFNQWTSQTVDVDSDAGRRLADLLLFDVRSIHNVHNRAPEAGFWNQYRDVPTFRYEINHEVALLASTDLGEQNRLASAFIAVLLQLVPVVFQPATVRGSIQKSDDGIKFLVTLEGYRPLGVRRKRVSTVWSAAPASAKNVDWERAVELLAYSLYLEMAGAEFFRSAAAFGAYTKGLRYHLAYVDFKRSADYRNAEEQYRRAAKLDPGAAPPRYNLAALYYSEYRQEANDAAIRELLKVVSVNDRRLQAEARSALANCYLQQYHRFNQYGTPEEAAALLDRSIRYARQALGDAKNLDAVHKALAFAYHQKSEFQTKNRKSVRGSVRVRVLQRIEIGRSRRSAIRHYSSAVRRNKRHYVAYNNVGNLYLNWALTISSMTWPARLERARRIRRSLAKFERSVQLHPSYYHAHDNIGNAHLALGQFDEAERSFLDALDHNEQYAEAKNDIAVLCATTGRAVKPRGSGSSMGAAEWHLAAIRTPDVGPGQRQKLCRQVAHVTNDGALVCPFQEATSAQGVTCGLEPVVPAARRPDPAAPPAGGRCKQHESR